MSNEPDAIAIRLPYPPTVNTYYRTAKGRTYMSPAGRAFKAEATTDVRRVFDIEPITCRVGVAITLHAENRTRDTDIDNRVKAVLEVLQGTVIENDRQVDELIVSRGCVCKPGHCDVIVSPLD